MNSISMIFGERCGIHEPAWVKVNGRKFALVDSKNEGMS